jgi:DNA-directed RNA polymerase specialized sigma24 family protein
MTKKELRQYRPILLELEQLDRNCERLYAIVERCVKNARLLPGRVTPDDQYPDIMDKLDAVRKQSVRKCRKLLKLHQRIEAAIDGLDSLERYLMRARYIEGLRWEEIAERLSYDVRHITRLHGYALQKMS